MAFFAFWAISKITIYNTHLYQIISFFISSNLLDTKLFGYICFFNNGNLKNILISKFNL